MSETEWPSAAFIASLELLDRGQSAESLDLMRNALLDCERSGHEHRSAQCLKWIGILQADIGDLGSAEVSLRRALDLLVVFDDVELAGDCRGELGTVLADSGSLEEAIELLRDTCAVCAEIGDFESEAEYSGVLGQAYEKLELPDQARLAYQRASEYFKVAERWSEAAHCCERTGTCLMDLDDGVGARREFIVARDLFEREGDDLDVARCQYLFGLCSGTENLDEAVAELRCALSYFDSTGRIEAVGDCWEQLGDLYWDAGLVDETFDAMTRALSRHQESGRQLRSAHCHSRLGQVHANRRSVESAILSFATARDLYAEEEPVEAADIDILLGGIHEDLGRLAEAASIYMRARRTYVTLDDPVAVAVCDMHIATVRMHMGEYLSAERALIDAASVFEAASEPVLRAEALRYRATVRSTLQEMLEAESLLREALQLVEGHDVAEFETDCRQDLAILRLTTADYESAISELGQARASFADLGKHEKASLCLQQTGWAFASLGRYSEAERALIDSRANLAKNGAIAASIGSTAYLAQIYLETGRLDDSETLYVQARDAYELMGAHDRVAGIDQNLGGIYLARGDLDAAEESFERAVGQFTGLGRHSWSALCQSNLGGVVLLKGDFARASSLIDSAVTQMRTDPAHRRAIVGAERNRACAELLLGHKDRGLVYLGASRAAALELGTMLEVARCDFLSALWIVDMDSDEGLREGIDLALPAVRYLDSRRFQFTVASTRAAWTKTIALWSSYIFDWAHRLGDEELLSELVESTINAGTHVSQVSDDASKTTMDLVSPGLDLGLNIDRTQFGTAVTTMAGSLIVGAVLPMQPPPKLLMPDGRIALNQYLRSMNTRYGVVPQTSVVSVV